MTKKGGAAKTPPAKKVTPVAKKGTKAKKPPTKGTRNQPKRGSKKETKPLTAEELDRQMDDYMMKSEKTAGKKLDEDMDSYWEQKKAKEAEAAEKEGTEDTPAGEAKA